MKHCKSCDKCTLDLVSFYIKDFECYKCACDGHLIENLWWERCNKYEKGRNDRFSSLLYEIVQVCRGKRRKLTPLGLTHKLHKCSRRGTR